MSAVIDALEFGEDPPPELIRALEHAAATAMTEAYEPVAAVAFRLARSTEANRITEAAGVRRRAQDTAALVAETTFALRQRHDRGIDQLANDATAAAALTAAAADQAQIRLALEAEQAADLVERDALQAAAVIQATALSVMYEIAIDAACRHFLVPLPSPNSPHAP